MQSEKEDLEDERARLVNENADLKYRKDLAMQMFDQLQVKEVDMVTQEFNQLDEKYQLMSRFQMQKLIKDNEMEIEDQSI